MGKPMTEHEVLVSRAKLYLETVNGARESYVRHLLGDYESAWRLACVPLEYLRTATEQQKQQAMRRVAHWSSREAEARAKLVLAIGGK